MYCTRTLLPPIFVKFKRNVKFCKQNWVVFLESGVMPQWLTHYVEPSIHRLCPRPKWSVPAV